MMQNHREKTVLITGGTGTFGNSFIDHALDHGLFKKIVVLSRDEFKQFHMKSRLDATYGKDHNVNFIIGDVRDEPRLETAFKGVDYVINAAALKHVPVCEYNPQEAVKTNVIGTMNVCSAASKLGVEKVVHLSTDKACEPINFYGSTKQLAEKYVIHSNNFSFGTKMSAVRYGNIVGSRGSIVETILRTVNEGKPIKITHPEMTRFWLPITDAVEMVLWTISQMSGGEVIVPFAGASNVVEMSRAVCDSIHAAFRYEITGVRPGEKMHEQLLARNEFDRALLAESHLTKNRYVVIIPEEPQWDYSLPRKMRDMYPTPLSRKSFASDDPDFSLNSEQLLSLVRMHHA